MKNPLAHIALLSFALSLIAFPCKAQNLVPNPSFEQYTSCPNNQCQIHRATGWSAWGYSPDYFNICGMWPATIPGNSIGYQYAPDGNNYSGIFVYDSLNTTFCGFCREYIGTSLISPLSIGQQYYVKFKISLADKSTYAINNIGMLFSSVSFAMDSTTACTNTNTKLLPQNFAHVYISAVVFDTANWTIVSGSFVADSTYQYLAIGNHFDDLNTTSIKVNNTTCCASYYYVDDIYVGTDSIISVFENEYQEVVSVFPNPFSFSCVVLLNEEIQDLKNAWYSIHTLVGEEAYNGFIPGRKFIIGSNNLPNGFYLLKIYFNDRMYIKKIILTK